MEGVTALSTRLLYGTGMRLMECIRLRIKDVDFDRHVIIVREAKGKKDRVVMLPRSLVYPPCVCNCLQRVRFGRQIVSPSVAGLKHRMRWSRNTPRWARRGAGSGYFRRPCCLLTRAAPWSGDIICA